ncbi:hypothetical protein B0H67DRAFT_13886 [Lasiosphaeris hirsuta]|uniref:Uncharacterized protein n=1 Tax=Lasiosphaeris hirsuta TaxID=260670 RepID=A0AA40E6B9_9PEZI|nr:hypothetical protein B0H67DRAFT_13886 [Lasiosphaeris hirsuta]
MPVVTTQGWKCSSRAWNRRRGCSRITSATRLAGSSPSTSRPAVPGSTLLAQTCSSSSSWRAKEEIETGRQARSTGSVGCRSPGSPRTSSVFSVPRQTSLGVSCKA